MSDTRDHIIQVAGKLFLQSNYDGVSIQDITQAVGMTKGALYHHFSSKEQLFEEVAHSLVRNFLTDFSTLPKDSFRGFYCALTDNLLNREENARKAGLPNILDSGINFYNLIWDAVRLLPGFRAFIDSFNTIELSAWTEAIKAAIGRGEIRREFDAQQLARIFISVADGVGITSMQKGGQIVMYREILELWDALYQSLKT